jgi:glycosyltransferase involved in cell wall biosynthesis
VDPEQMKPTLELGGREVILSFGLLGPGKGYAEMIEALPAVVAAHPTACYVIVGATLADLADAEDETCRAALVARVAALGLTEHVRFVDRFVGRVELSRWLEAADVFVAPYRDPDKDSSGTLAYAMGAGRATVSTRYACAEELLADGRGVVVASASAGDLATALDALLRDPERRAAIGRRAYDHTRSMTWSRIGAEYRSLLGSVASAAAPTHAAPAGGRAPRASRHRSAVAAAEA